MIPAVIYARYSSSGQREESIEGQIRECTEYAERNGFHVLRSYTDKALTGRTDKRPGFQQMIRDSEKKAFQAVICWKTDRFARNRYDAAVYKARLRKNDVRLYYAREAIPEGAEGIILESVMEGFAEYYSASLSENVKRGFVDSALNHKAHGRRIFGYTVDENDQFVPDPETAPIVRRIFEEYDAGKKQKQIYEDLMAEGLQPTNKRSAKVRNSWISKLLRNEAYIGVYTFKDEIRDEDAIPPIVDRDLFDRVQKRLAQSMNRSRERKTAEAPVRFLLTGKVFCGHCGQSMVGDSARSKSGKKHFYYTCYGKKRRTCDKKREPKEDLERLVVAELVRLLHSDQFISEMADACVEHLQRPEENGDLIILENQKKNLEIQIGNLTDALAYGSAPKSVIRRISEMEAQLEEVDRKIAELRLQEAPKLTRDHFVFYLEKLRDAAAQMPGSKYEEMLVEYFFNSVFVYDDKLILHVNSTPERSEAVTFERNADLCSDRDSESPPLASLSEHGIPVVSVVIFRNG